VLQFDNLSLIEEMFGSSSSRSGSSDAASPDGIGLSFMSGDGSNSARESLAKKAASTSRLQSKQKLSMLLKAQKSTASGVVTAAAGSSTTGTRRKSASIDAKESKQGWLWRKNEGFSEGLGGPFIKMYCVVDQHKLVYYDKQPSKGGIADDKDSRGYISITKESTVLCEEDDQKSDMWSGMGKAMFTVSEGKGNNVVKVSFSAGTDAERTQWIACLYKAIEGFEHRSDRRRAEAKKRLEERQRAKGGRGDDDTEEKELEDYTDPVEIRYEYLEPPIKTGQIRKKAIGGFMGLKNTKQRWFRLEAGELRYYDKKSMKPSRLKGVVSLKGGADVGKTKHEDRDEEIQLNLPDGRQLVLKCDDAATAIEWRRAFKETIRIFDGAAAQYKDKKRKRNIAITKGTGAEGLRRDSMNVGEALTPAQEEAAALANLDKSPEAVASIDKALQGHFLLGELDREGHDALIHSMSFTSLLPGDVVIWQNTWGTAFYVVEKGKTQVVKDAKVVAELPEGTGFGELALVNDVLRTATIRATNPCRLWSIDRGDFRAILAREEQVSRERKIGILKNIDLFAKLNLMTLGQVADSLKTTFFDDEGHVIFRQGENGDKFYIIRDGTVSVKVDRAEVAILKSGDAFGERALINDEPRSATTTTLCENVVCYVLDRDRFNDLLGQYSQAMDENFAVEALAKVDILKGLSHTKMKTIAENMSKEVFGEGKIIFHQGETGDKFYVLAAGSVKVIVNHVVVGEISPGQYFGEKALLASSDAGERTATILAASTKVVTFSLGREAFTNLLGPVETIMEDEARRREEEAKEGSILGRMSRILSPGRGSKVDGLGAQKMGNFQTNNVCPVDVAGVQELLVLQTLGKGEFTVCSLVSHEVSGEIYSLKRLPKAEVVEKLSVNHVFDNKNFLLEFAGGINPANQEEVAPLSPLFPKLLATFSDPANVYFVSELCPGGDMHNVFYHTNYLRKTKMGGVPETVVAFYVASALSLLNFLHSRDVVYRNMRLDNMLIGDDGYVKFCDMTFCKQMDSEASTTNTMCGCGDYISPEMVLAKPYNRGVDYWALGILTFELLGAQTPFEDLTLAGIFQNVLNCTEVLPKSFEKLNERSEGAPMSESVTNFVSQLLKEKFSMRLGLVRGGNLNVWNQPFLKSRGLTYKTITECGVEAPYIPELSETGGAHEVQGFENFGDDVEDFTFYEDVEPYDGPGAADFAMF